MGFRNEQTGDLTNHKITWQIAKLNFNINNTQETLKGTLLFIRRWEDRQGVFRVVLHQVGMHPHGLHLCQGSKLKLQAYRLIIGDAAYCFCDFNWLRWNLEMMIDSLERELWELCIMYSQVKNEASMYIWWLFEINIVVGDWTRFRTFYGLILISFSNHGHISWMYLYPKKGLHVSNS